MDLNLDLDSLPDPEKALDDPWQLVRLSMGSFAGETWRATQSFDGYEKVGRLRPLPPGSTWWQQYQETQSFDDFTSSLAFRPNSTAGDIHLLLFGEPEAVTAITHWDEVVVIVEAFVGFHTVCLEALPIDDWAPLRKSADGRAQRGAHFLLSHLAGCSDVRVVCTLAVTGVDLYPPRKFDYITGMTDAKNRIGVFSTSRYFGDKRQNNKDERLAMDMDMKRLLSICLVKVLVRECLKLCGFRECLLLECLMNPFPGIKPEAINQLPLELCPICLRKLLFMTQVDALDRLVRLPPILETWFPEESQRLTERLLGPGFPTIDTSARLERRRGYFGGTVLGK